ncbi:MAG: hypothetical protein ACLQBX_18930 [Candidatus Limnocylindrales bacterium]
MRWNVDDAAAGYASLHYLAELRPHDIKLDRSLREGVGSASFVPS